MDNVDTPLTIPTITEEPPEEAEPDQAAQAFHDLRGEVALLRHALEAMFATSKATPDYAPTLSKLDTDLSRLINWALWMKNRPSLDLTPDDLARQISDAGSIMREQDRALLAQALAKLDASAKTVDQLAARDSTAKEQKRIIHITAGSGFLGGVFFIMTCLYLGSH